MPKLSRLNQSTFNHRALSLRKSALPPLVDRSLNEMIEEDRSNHRQKQGQVHAENGFGQQYPSKQKMADVEWVRELPEIFVPCNVPGQFEESGHSDDYNAQKRQRCETRDTVPLVDCEADEQQYRGHGQQHLHLPALLVTPGGVDAIAERSCKKECDFGGKESIRPWIPAKPKCPR